MLSLALITQTFQQSFQQIQELLPYLANSDPSNILAYVDMNPSPRSLDTALYSLGDGQILVALREGEFNTGEEMSYISHTLEVALRSLAGQSVEDMFTVFMNGVPQGQNLRWRYLQLLPELYSTDLKTYTRQTDAQIIDFFVVQFEVKETGDA